MSHVLIRYVLRAAIRDRILIALLLALIAGTSLAIFLGSSSVVESGQFAGVFAGAGLRIVGVLALVLFVVFHVRRSFESKDIEFLLSRPVSRAQFLFSFAAAFSILAVVAGIAEGLCIAAIAPVIKDSGFLLWFASILVENIIIVNVALFFALILSSATSGVLACLGFYVLTRLMGQLLGIIDAGLGVQIPFSHALRTVFQCISALMPRLDLMGQTSWLMYGPDGTVSYGFLCMQGAVFTALILAASMVDLARRKF